MKGIAIFFAGCLVLFAIGFAMIVLAIGDWMFFGHSLTDHFREDET